jgi:type IV pilus assembly protein PilB
MQASLTGHLVLSSMHAVDAVAALHRFTDMGIEPFLVASAVSGVIGQRLLRRNCPSCTVEYKPSPDRIRLVASMLGTGKATFKRGEGCNMCNNTGYRGRSGVYELLKVTDAIRQQIVEKDTHTAIRKTAIREGMVTMQLQAFQMAADGVTTVDEVVRAVYAPGVELDGEPIGELEAPRKQLETPPPPAPAESPNGSQAAMPLPPPPPADAIASASGGLPPFENGGLPPFDDGMTPSDPTLHRIEEAS